MKFLAALCGSLAAVLPSCVESATGAFASLAKPPLLQLPRVVPVPTPQQLEWMDLEVGAMITWNAQTICSPKGGSIAVSSQRCQSSSRTEGQLFMPTPEATAQWNPDKLDTDQWAEVSASFGAKYIVLVADHMAGFALWNTSLHNYSITNTARGGDVVRELLASCRKYGLKLGFFYSVHFNWWVGLDNFKLNAVPPLGGAVYHNMTRDQFDALATAQLNELLDIWEEDQRLHVNDQAGGDEAFEIWFDGGTGPFNDTIAAVVRNRTRFKGKNSRSLCHSCFPFTQDDDIGANGDGYGVRWMGNEEGVMPLPSWGALDNVFQQVPYNGDPYGELFQPPSVDTVLREHFWFWQPDTETSLKSTPKLVSNYLTSVGRAANLILNIAPDDTGAIPTVDVARYKEMGAAIHCLYAYPVATSTTPLPMDENGTMTLAFQQQPVSATNVSVVLMEDLTRGQLIGNFTLECLVSNASFVLNNRTWQACPMGSLPGSIPAIPSAGIGHKRIHLLALPAGGSLSGIRIRVDTQFNASSPDAKPTLRSVSLYDWEPCAD